MEELKNKNILFVEDDAFIGQMLVRRLSAAGAFVDWAKNGREGLEKVREKDYDIIVTDLMMSQVDGYEMLSIIQSDEKTKNIPVVVLTNKTSLNESTSKINELNIEVRLTKSTTALSETVRVIANVLKKNKKTD